MHLSIPGSPWRIPPGKPPWPSNQQPTPGFNLGGGANPGQIGSVDKDNQPTPRMDTCMLPPPTARRPPLEHAFVRHEGPTRVPRGSPLGSPRKISQRIPWGISQAPLRGSTRGILQGTPGDPPVTLRPPPGGSPEGSPWGIPPGGPPRALGGPWPVMTPAVWLWCVPVWILVQGISRLIPGGAPEHPQRGAPRIRFGPNPKPLV